MKRQKRMIQNLVAGLAVAVLLIPGLGGAARAAGVCGEGLGVPPFLAQGEDPNVLLIIDNSASMYDLAYVPTEAAQQGTCLDTSFNSGKSYAGYFDAGWYYYDLDNKKFVQVADQNAMTSACNTAAGTKYSNDQVCVKVDMAAVAGSQVKFFGAASNFLNWAAASKFDAEKKVLTGGKFYPPDSPNNVLMVMESRGCMGKEFVKQVNVKKDAELVASYKLVLGIISLAQQDVDPKTDYLTRINIHEINTNGIMYDNASCQDALQAFTTNNFGQINSNMTPCAEAAGKTVSASKTADQHVLHDCWYYSKQGDWPGGNFNDLKNDCEKIYGVSHTPPPEPIPVGYVSPSTLQSWDICFGDFNLAGYMGRCWQTTAAGEPYYTTVCTPGVDTPTGTIATAPAAVFCDSASSKWYECNGKYNNGQKTCEAVKNPVTLPGQWVVKNMLITPGGATVGWLNDNDACLNSAVQSYCGTISEPGIPDPSDAISSSGSTWNIPAALMQFLVDTHVGAPLLSMKGLVARADAPTGILEVFGDSIRFGTMAFNDGTFSECYPREVKDKNGNIIRYEASLYDCLVAKSPNITAATTAKEPSMLDGAHIVTIIGKNSTHMTALKKGINDLVATTWTPTAEAYYEAIGYYTQKSEMRINPGDYIVNSDHPSYTTTWSAGSDYAANDIVKDSNDKLYKTFTAGKASNKQADGETASTGPKDDGSTDLTWTPIDPVVNYCQANNILILTDGASTADQMGSEGGMVAKATGEGDDNSPDETISPVNYDCGVLKGSTLLDDLAYHGFNGAIYPSANFTNEETGLPVTGRNISSFIVSNGTPRKVQVGNLPAECDSETLLSRAAQNGGSSLFVVENPAELEDGLRDVFEKIKAGMASGSASSVISASRGGEGAIYQAIFWPRMVDQSDTVTWIGDVHALLIDTFGNMYEDDGYLPGFLNTKTPRQLTQTAPGAATYTNSRVVFYYDSAASQTMACNGDLNAAGNDCPNPGVKKGLNQVKYLWSTAEWLSTIAPHPAYKPAPASMNLASVAADAAEDIKTNRAAYLSKDRQRYVYSWIDLNSDGVVDQASEWLPFTRDANLGAKATSPGRGLVTLDFGVNTTTEVNNIVDWIRGFDTVPSTTIRSRQRNFTFDPDWNWDNTPPALTWRLADVIHSTPIAVTRPSENLHLLYKDASYAAFAQHYNQRRHVIYYGSNGGMLHAVNGGFYDDQNKRFCRTAACDDEGDWPDIVSPELGAELWAYVPYNLLPHLKCLMDPEYEHKYYVDLRPRVFDVKLWDPDATHIQGWGTILVVGMRFGGSPVDASVNTPGDTRRFSSSYIIMDVTDPEQPPKLLGELTHTSVDPPDYANLAYTTAIPTVVPMKDGNTYNWYLVMGSGPTKVDGTSDQRARLAVYNLKRLTEASPDAFRVDLDPPDALLETGTWEIQDDNSFISDLISVDFETKENYKADAVYFGTVSGDWGNWGGKMYRLVTREIDTVSCNQEATTPSQWAGLLGVGKPNPSVLIDVGQPVTAAASVGTDYFNYWVYFGTGRFFDRQDKSDNSSNATQYYYGVKEPRLWGGVGCTDIFTWEKVEKTAGNGPAGQGSLGLKDVTKIRALNNSPASSATLYCETADPTDYTDKTCLPNGVDTFHELVPTIAGSGSAANLGTDGWYRGLTIARERNLGQATLLGGLLTYTTYQPYLNLCLPEGLGYLYGLYYQTGTPWHKAVFGSQAVNTPVEYRIDMGRGLATTPNLHVGSEAGTKAFVQTSTGAIIEIEQPNLPLDNTKTGRRSWRQIKPAN